MTSSYLGASYAGEYIESDGSSDIIPPVITNASVPKTVQVHIYNDSNLTYIANWPDLAEFPDYDWAINGGPQSVKLPWPRAYGDSREPGESATSDRSLMLGNWARFYVVDKESPITGVLIYQGQIAEYEHNLAGEIVSVTFLSYNSLEQDRFINEKVTYTDYDPAWIFQNLLGLTPELTYDVGGSMLVGTLVTQSYERTKLAQALDLTRSLAGGTWFYRLNPDNTVIFRDWGQVPVADHTFVVGKHLSENVVFKKSKMATFNRIFVFGAVGIVGVAYDIYAGSFTDKEVYNPNITDGGQANRIAAILYDYYNQYTFESTVTVMDSNFDATKGYDIESIKPGQIAQILNTTNVFAFPKIGDHTIGDGHIVGGTWFAQTQKPIVIAKVAYRFDRVILTLQRRPQSFVEALFSVSDRLLIKELS